MTVNSLRSSAVNAMKKAGRNGALTPETTLDIVNLNRRSNT